MSKIKRQHYVPKFYLKRFTREGRQLFVFDKVSRESRKSNMANVAVERYFYDVPHDLPVDRTERQIVERGLAEIEAHFSHSLEDLLRTVEAGRDINDRQRLNIAFLITLQILRTREYRDFFKEFMEKGLKGVLDKVVKFEELHISPDEYQVRYNDQLLPLDHALSMFNFEKLARYAQVLSSHIWFIGINKTTQPLYTSDSPVVRRPHREDPFRSYAGLASEGIEIAFPLSPKYVLILCERTFFSEFAELDCKSIPLDIGNVTYYNSLQVFKSRRQIYCPSNKFNLARQICKEHPEICDPDRDRVQVL